MGVDIPATIRRFADDVHYVHFRDNDGTAEALETWLDVGFEGPMRSDHVPMMAGKSNDDPGYETKGRLFAIGYMRGLLETIGE